MEKQNPSNLLERTLLGEKRPELANKFDLTQRKVFEQATAASSYSSSSSSSGRR
jgi:hypothetical protein